MLDGRATAVRPETEVVADELMGKRFVSEGALKAVWMPPPHGRGRWQLFDLAADPSERADLARARPGDLQRLVAHWDEYARRNRVILPDWVSGY